MAYNIDEGWIDVLSPSPRSEMDVSRRYGAVRVTWSDSDYSRDIRDEWRRGLWPTWAERAARL